MDPTVLVAVAAFTALAMVSTFTAVAVWQIRRIVLTVFGESRGAAQLGQRGYRVRPPELSGPPAAPVAPPASAVPPGSSRPGPPSEPAPGSLRARAVAPAVGPPPGARAVARAVEPAVPLDAAKPARESLKLPALAPAPDYAEQAKRPAPDADDGDSAPGQAPAQLARTERETVRPPAVAREEPELRQAAPETTPEPSRVPTTRPLPSSQQRPPASGAHVAVAPPASATVLAPGPGMVAAGLGERPSGARSERPSPHRPPVAAPQPSPPARKPTLLGIPPALPPSAPAPPPVSPAKRGSSLGAMLAAARSNPALPTAATPDEFDDPEEATRMLERPEPELREPSSTASTLPSMSAVVPSSPRAVPIVDVVAARLEAAGASLDEDGDGPTIRGGKPGDAPAPEHA